MDDSGGGETAPYEPSPPVATRIGCDNPRALKLIQTGASKQKTKHIDIKYYHIRGEVAERSVSCYCVRTTDNWVDLPTKAPPARRDGVLVGLVGLRHEGGSRAEHSEGGGGSLSSS